MADECRDLLALSVREFLAQTAAKTPTPGGGSVAAVTGALGAALGQMAMAFTQGKKKFAAYEKDYAHLVPRLERARRMFEAMVADDVAAFQLYQKASRLGDDDPGKGEAVALALAVAINIPRQATKLSLALLEDLHALADKCSPYLISDLEAAGALAVATIRLSDYNVRINTPQLADKDAASQLREGSRADLGRAENLLREIERAAEECLS